MTIKAIFFTSFSTENGFRALVSAPGYDAATAREELLGSYHRVEWCVADNTLALADGARANESFRIRNALAMRRAHEMFSAKFMKAASTLF